MSLETEKYTNGAHDLTITKSGNSNVHMATITSKNDPSMNMVIPIKESGPNTFLPSFCGTTATSGLCSMIQKQADGKVIIPGFDEFTTVVSRLFPSQMGMSPSSPMMMMPPQTPPSSPMMMSSPTPPSSPTPSSEYVQGFNVSSTKTTQKEVNMEEIEGFNIGMAF